MCVKLFYLILYNGQKGLIGNKTLTVKERRQWEAADITIELILAGIVP